MTAPYKPCIDCVKDGAINKRKTSPPGPRCATHKREKRSERRDTSWEKRILALYSLTVEVYWLIYEFQGGRCYICRRATGVRKRLSVDHDHKTGLVRGLLCTMCNRNVLGHLRDDPEAVQRAKDYLLDPPAKQLGLHIVAPT